MMTERYMQYLPATVSEYTEFQRLGEIEGVILEEEAQAKAKLEANQWIQTASRAGLLRRADMMGIAVSESDDTEWLRETILSYWNSHRPYTYFMLCDWLDGFCGAENYRAKLAYDAYRLTIVLELNQKEKKEQILRHWRLLIPANIVLEVQLNTNTYGKVGQLRHRTLQENQWTYGEIPFVDLREYLAE